MSTKIGNKINLGYYLFSKCDVFLTKISPFRYLELLPVCNLGARRVHFVFTV